MKRCQTSIIAYNSQAWYNTCMSLGYELTIEQTQKLSMTPELIQAIQILQYNNEELNEFIKNELLENPLLEVERERGETDAADNNSDINIDELREKVAESGYEMDFSSDYHPDYAQDFSYERYVSFRYSLIEYLLLQLQLTEMDEDHAAVGRFLIHNIDDNGYLTIELEEAAETMNAELSLVEETLEIIQTFDPPGVGARTLCESLMIQLRQKGELSKELEKVLCDHLEDIACHKITAIAKEIGKTEKEVQHFTDIIKSLEPKPGRAYDSDRTVKYVIPDVVVEKSGTDYRISNYDAGTPSLMVSSYYGSMKEEMGKDAELSKYLNERMNSAVWLLRSIEQRKQTILKVATAIVEHQKEYFDKGEHYLKPLTLKQIAENVGVHESTVSRAINGKYMQTGRGVLEMKYFFTSGVKSDDGDDLSSSSIKAKIKEIVGEENSNKPYSDQKIVEILNNEGIDISRRTVAKYREAIGILPSSKRKRY